MCDFFTIQGMMPTTVGAAGQIMRNNAFTLTGNTQNTQIVSMTGASCLTDWLSIPCAINSGRMPSMSLICVDRLCGGTFNAETQNLNASSVISKFPRKSLYYTILRYTILYYTFLYYIVLVSVKYWCVCVCEILSYFLKPKSSGSRVSYSIYILKTETENETKNKIFLSFFGYFVFNN